MLMRLHAIFGLALLPLVGGAQTLLNDGTEPVRLLPGDAAILDSHDSRTDLPCKARPIKPELGFDLGMHSGYEVTVPLADLAGSGNRLVALFRVTPEGHADRAVYMSQKWSVPTIPRDAKGSAALEGAFLLGEGRYQVDWLMRDMDDRYCSARWQITAEPRVKEKPIELRMAPGTIAPKPVEPFYNEAPLPKDDGRALKVLVLLHVASGFGMFKSHAGDTDAVLSILRGIAREPRINQYSIVAFNLERSEILFRSDNHSEIDFKGLGETVKPNHLATVDVRTLGQKDADIQFLHELLAAETARSRPDALIFVGQKSAAFFGVRGVFKQADAPAYPVFYLNYDAEPTTNPWRDLIGSVVRLWNGVEYRINKPRDLFAAWNDVMFRISTQDPAAGATARSDPFTPLLPKK